MESSREKKHLSIFFIIQQAMNYAFENIRSPNLIDKVDIELPDNRLLVDALNEMRKIEILEPEYSLAWIHTMSQLAEEYGVGNCCEKTCVVFSYIERIINKNHLSYHLNMEIFNNPFSDHFFIVIGRTPSSDSSDPRTWPASTIICDPWKETEPYTIQDISFEELHHQPYTMIEYLIDNSEKRPSLILQQNIYSLSLSPPTEHLPQVIPQDTLVLRSRLSLNTQNFLSFNQNVPIVFEDWDRPSIEEDPSHKLMPH